MLQVSLWKISYRPHNYCRTISIKYSSGCQGNFGEKEKQSLGQSEVIYIYAPYSSPKTFYNPSQDIFQPALLI